MCFQFHELYALQEFYITKRLEPQVALTEVPMLTNAGKKYLTFVA